MTSSYIPSNLEALHLTDMVVQCTMVYGECHDGDFSPAQRYLSMLLSEVCTLGVYGVADRLDLNGENIDLNLYIEYNDQNIGYVDSHGIFHFQEAQDLRSALGWFLATDGGREHPLNCDLDYHSREILEAITRHGVSEETFLGSYQEALKKALIYGSGSERHLICGRILWQVATYELFGKKDPGYDFVP